uniref:Uncharacterized protein n=1 Tax=Anguilla anguilla TaxID=7936 RepID=A0A0E9UR64_ANGAN
MVNRDNLLVLMFVSCTTKELPRPPSITSVRFLPWMFIYLPH